MKAAVLPPPSISNMMVASLSDRIIIHPLLQTSNHFRRVHQLHSPYSLKLPMILFTHGVLLSLCLYIAVVPSCLLPTKTLPPPPYTFCLVDGTIHSISPDFLESILTTEALSQHMPEFTHWLGNSQKVMYLYQGEYRKGHMAWDIDKSQWRFTQCKKNGVEIFGILPNFHHDFQCFINDDTLVPSWHTGKSFLLDMFQLLL